MTKGMLPVTSKKVAPRTAWFIFGMMKEEQITFKSKICNNISMKNKIYWGKHTFSCKHMTTAIEGNGNMLHISKLPKFVIVCNYDGIFAVD